MESYTSFLLREISADMQIPDERIATYIEILEKKCYYSKQALS